MQKFPRCRRQKIPRCRKQKIPRYRKGSGGPVEEQRDCRYFWESTALRRHDLQISHFTAFLATLTLCFLALLAATVAVLNEVELRQIASPLIASILLRKLLKLLTG